MLTGLQRTLETGTIRAMQQKHSGFRKPPLIETAVSVQFKPMERLKNAHLGIFWESVRDEFPNVSDAEPIAEQFEAFGDQALRGRRLPEFRIVSGQMMARLQMSSRDEQEMVQIQNGRVVFNWRRVKDGEYPRWNSVYRRFKDVLGKLNGYLTSQGLEEVSPTQWEITYVNHLEKGRDWQQSADWQAMLPGMLGNISGVSTGTAESLGCSVHLLLPAERGRVHIDLYHGFASAEPGATELLILQITARGGIGNTPGHTIVDGLEVGHTAIVRTFCDITGPDNQKKWEPV